MCCRVVYPYKEVDTWEGCKETRLLSKNAFHSKLYLEDQADYDYKHEE